MITISEKQTLPSENSSNLCNASFSSYLNDSDDTFVRKLGHSSPNLNSIVPSPSHNNAYIPKKKVLDGEIGIFGAEKYFTGAIDEEISVISTKGNSPKSSHHQQDREEQVFDECPVKHKTQAGTPSVRSEASWNSRSALLQSSSRNQPQKETNKVSNVKSFLASLGCNCNGKDSVKVHKKTGEDRGVHGKEITKPMKNGDLVVRTTKSLSSRWAEEENQSKKLDRSSYKKEDCFSFPVMNSKAGDQAVKIQLQEEKEIIRNSLEVFGSPIMEKAKKSFSLERKLTTLNWDGVTMRVQDIKIPPPNQNGTYDDTASDASSDLFEIESFSTNGNSFLGRQASEAGMSNPSNCYAPSEASIDWSVATAGAADFSVISDYNELRRGGIAKSSSTIAWNMKSDKQGNEVVQKRAPGILSGCASLKSVRVAGDEYRTTTEKVAIGSPRVMHRLDSAKPIAKFQAETKLTGFDSRSRGQNGFVTRTLPRSHSPHTSRLLYIQ